MSTFYLSADSLTDPHAWIQWKGTDVCADAHCACGEVGHVDAEFFYNYRCRACGRVYEVGSSVRLYELTPEQSAEVGDDVVEDGGNK